MKRLFRTALTALVAAALGACSMYDDTELRDRLDDIDDKIASLEEAVKGINSDIDALQRIIDALEAEVTIDKVESNEDGYIIYFSDGTTAEITNGTDGTNAPVISVAQDETDGLWYWTVDGEWLIVDGRKVRAQGVDGEDGKPGADAVAPQVRINPDTKMWEISVDGGRSWESTGVVAEGQGGSGVIVDVDYTGSAYNVIFTLVDGTQISVPKTISVEFEIDGLSPDGYESIAFGESRTYNVHIKGMLNHMIKLTFNEDGTPTGNGLDVDYLDQMVYGFFETPAYWRNTTTGEISFDDKSADGNYVYVAAIPAGQSFSAYIMGDDTRLTQAKYSVSNNYMAQQFATKVDQRNTSVANFTFADINNTKYAYKKQMNVAKTPEWAQGITGVPKEKIEELAEFYLQCAKDRTPVYNEWAGGQLKQNDGTITLYALQSLLIISKNWGITGTGIKNNSIGVNKDDDPNQIAESLLRPAAWDDGTIQKMGPHPKISVTQWHNAIKMAFSQELAANGYVPNIPDWVNASGAGKPKYNAGQKGQVYFDDGGVKSLVNRQGITGVGKDAPETFTTTINMEVPGKGTVPVTHTYYNFKGSGFTDKQNIQSSQLTDRTNDENVLFSGFRFILNSAGNIPMNQHANPIDSARMYKALPTYGYGPHPTENMADAFYLVTFDNFMSPSARYSDYVLPAKTTWEQEDFVTIENSGTLYVDSVIPGPGESKSSWDFVRELIYHYGGKAEAVKFTGLNSNSSFRDVVQKQYNEKVKTNAQSPYYGKTWEEFLEKPISHAKPVTERADILVDAIRQAYETKQPMDPFYPGVLTVDWSNDSKVFGFGNDLHDTGIHSFAETDTCPKQTGMFQVYSGTLVWRYENLYSKWHGYLPKERQGQINRDEEGDPIAWPIPVYFDYQDHFRVAYGLNSNDDLNGRYLLTTTHDRFRAHSSQAENPFLRELTHRTIGGALYSGNDSGAYAVSDGLNAEGYETFPALNTLIGEDGKPVAGAENRASYTDIWVNDVDFADFNDGDLVKVSNEIGAVYCTIRKTARCVPGYVGLHQGCWVDFRGDINNKDSLIDVGGNCNTLMPSTPSRLDHGNGVQSAMVKIERV